MSESARKRELLDACYRYVLEHGLVDLSLRPLAAAVGSSPRVLLFLFGSKDGLVRELLGCARRDELALLRQLDDRLPHEDTVMTVRTTWHWLVAPQHRQLLVLWLEAYTRSLVEPEGPWAGFARRTVDDWLAVLAPAASRGRRRSKRSAAESTLALAVLRGALLDLLATGDVMRTSAAVERYLDTGGPIARDSAV